MNKIIDEITTALIERGGDAPVAAPVSIPEESPQPEEEERSMDALRQRLEALQK